VVTTAYIQGIFRRHGWSYQVDDDGDIRTGFDGVPLIIFVQPNGVRIATIVFRASGREIQAMRARSREMELVLASINTVATDGYFEFDHDDAVFYSTAIPLTGSGSQDEARLMHGLQLAVAAYKGVGVVIARLVRGQITMQQALEVIERAVRDSQRGRGAA
jgi:hypothetical protein